MKARVTVSKGWPGERSTSCTMGGNVEGSVGPTERDCHASRLLRHSAHTPSIPDDPPQVHFRCKRHNRVGVKDVTDFGVFLACVCKLVRAYVIPNAPALRHSLYSGLGFRSSDQA